MIVCIHVDDGRRVADVPLKGDNDIEKTPAGVAAPNIRLHHATSLSDNKAAYNASDLACHCLIDTPCPGKKEATVFWA